MLNSPLDRLLDATNSGLDIITWYFPDAAKCTDGKRKFRLRAGEHTPSASLKLFGNQYKVTDFGGSGKALSAIDIAMEQERLAFNDALSLLCQRYGISYRTDSPQTFSNYNKPRIETLAADPTHADGERAFEFNEHFSDSELKVMGPAVSQEHCDDLGWRSVRCLTIFKADKTVKKYSAPGYPIFVRECRAKNAPSFYKIYEPYAEEKQWRFSYYPSGGKPQNYINGLDVLEKRYRDFNAELEREFRAKEGNEDHDYHYTKLPHAVLCSGERDAMCVRSLGYYPLWLNSETADLSDADLGRILRYVEVLYNIPDIDSTGIRQGGALAMRHIDIHTVWLPFELSRHRDRRGKPCKDFRDWMEHNAASAAAQFKKMLELAMPVKFWQERYSKRTGETTYHLDTNCLLNFLQLNGFFTLKDDHAKDTRFIRILGNVVKEVKLTDITNFVKCWADQRGLQREVRNLIIDTSKISPRSLAFLKERELDFTSATADTQLFFIDRGVIKVDGSGIYEEHQSDSLVWERDVIKHPFRKLDDMFDIAQGEDGQFDIEVKSVASHVFGYLINSSRLYWQKETDLQKFVIDSTELSAKEIADQKQCLVNKIFTIGYMLHRYKSPSRAWAPQAMDNRIDDSGECNGRSGKSFMFKFLSLFLNTVKLSGRNPKLMENPHVFGSVTEDTDLVLVDDCDRTIRANMFYDNITGDMNVNPKNIQSYSIPFERSPKFAFTTNYVPTDFDPSSEARLLYNVFGDYYHQKTEDNEYAESRSIRDDFNKDLFTSQYTDEEWNADINFMLQCCRFYLSLCNTAVKPLPPMENIIIRKYREDMGDNFQDWAETYFALGSENLDKDIDRRTAFEAYKTFSGVAKITMQGFTHKLKAFCAVASHVAALNPASRCNSSGRIIRNIDGHSTEMIHLESRKAPEPPSEPEPPKPVQSQLPFDAPSDAASDPFGPPPGDCPF